MGIDELDDLLDTHAELEALFKELEDRVDLEELRAEAWAEMQQEQYQGPPTSSYGGTRATSGETVEIDSGPATSPPPRQKPWQAPPKARPKAKPNVADPTAALKARLEGREEQLFLVVLCPGCNGKNRTRLDRLRTAVPRCGRCGGDLTRHR